MINNKGLKPFDIASLPIQNLMVNCIIDKLMKRKPDDDYGKEPTPGICVFCQAADPVLMFGPCPHIELCDSCYINNKEILKQCPICGKLLKRLKIRPNE